MEVRMLLILVGSQNAADSNFTNSAVATSAAYAAAGNEERESAVTVVQVCVCAAVYRNLFF